jgi:uncharacterized protein (DUF2249 family)
MSSTTRPVAAGDKVSDVLARDESLVDVFVRHAPHFEKLRNRAMRKVMARLVTVEQAARTAHVPADRLVRDLNAALGLAEAPAVEVVGSSPPVEGAPIHHRHPEDAPVVEVDVRDDLRSGREPFSKVMAAVAALRDGEVLRLRAIFEPAPLFGVLGKRGFAHEAEAHAEDDWSVWFWRPAPGDAIGTATPAPAARDDLPADDEHTTYLDVRGLNPPEPMLRTLAALESLAPGQVLVQVNQRVPQFLLPMLAERGFAWEVTETRDDRVLVRIFRAP